MERSKEMGVLGNKMKILCLICAIILYVAGDARGDEEILFVQELKEGLQEPVDSVLYSTGDVYVLDKKACQVVVYDKDGKMKTQFGEPGSEAGQLSKPNSIAISLYGEIIIADTGNSRIQVFTPEGLFSYHLGGYGSMRGHFLLPTHVAVDHSGFIYVADEENKAVSKFSPRGVFLEMIALRGKPMDLDFDRQQNMYILFSEEGKIFKYHPKKAYKEMALNDIEGNHLQNSLAIAVDMRGDIYLIEKEGHTIKKYDKDANMRLSFGSRGKGKGQFHFPHSIKADIDGKIYIADTYNKRIQIIEVSGSQEETLPFKKDEKVVIDFDMAIKAKNMIADMTYIPDKGLYALSDQYSLIMLNETDDVMLSQLDQEVLDLQDPRGLYVFRDGKMLVADTGHHRLQFLDAEGKPSYQFGRKGKDTSQFHTPTSIAVNLKGHIYVTDTFNNRVQIFNKDGIHLNSFGEKSEVKNDTIPRPGTFSQPTALLFDSKENLYVLDSKNKRIQIFDQKGVFLRQIGGLGDAGHKFIEPVDLAVDEHDYIYVADRGSHTLKIFDPQGAFIMDFGSSGNGPSYFPKLSAVAAYGGKIYVADYKVNKVKVFQFNNQNILKQERIVRTITSSPPRNDKSSEETKIRMARKKAIEKAQKEMPKEIEQDAEGAIAISMKIEAEKVLPNGDFEMTVSVPK
ncbi:MAG: 6-bladed beta-propeller [Candidatus Omnitrophica bacterium]|nr:6-bladed beta-propeller [Candidatus Omnitrophota bacterium]